MPRVTNGAIALVLLVLLSPIVVTWDDRTTLQRVFLCGMAGLVGIVALVCGTAALRPGALGRAARRARERRASAAHRDIGQPPG